VGDCGRSFLGFGAARPASIAEAGTSADPQPVRAEMTGMGEV
jgi:hypothetical protein